MRRVEVAHVVPHPVAFGALRFAPCRLERLSRDLHTYGLAGDNVEIPLRVRIGPALGRDDHDLPADVAVDERLDVNIARLAARVPDQAGGCHLAAAEGGFVNMCPSHPPQL